MPYGSSPDSSGGEAATHIPWATEDLPWKLPAPYLAATLPIERAGID